MKKIAKFINKRAAFLEKLRRFVDELVEANSGIYRASKEFGEFVLMRELSLFDDINRGIFGRIAKVC